MQSEMLIVSDADITTRCRSIIKPGIYMILPRANRVAEIRDSYAGQRRRFTPSIQESR